MVPPRPPSVIEACGFLYTSMPPISSLGMPSSELYWALLPAPLIGAFARHIKFFAGQKDVTVECRQVLSQAIDQYRGAFAGRAAIDLDAGQALQRFGHILVRHLADVLGRHGFDRQI